MISYKKANKKDLPMLIKYKLLTIVPYIEDDSEKLKSIAYVNNFVSQNYKNFILVYYFFKQIGIYYIDDNELDTLYIKEKFRNKGLGTKVLNKIKKDINTVKLKKNNQKALNFYIKNGFFKTESYQDNIILRKD